MIAIKPAQPGSSRVCREQGFGESYDLPTTTWENPNRMNNTSRSSIRYQYGFQASTVMINAMWNADLMEIRVDFAAGYPVRESTCKLDTKFNWRRDLK